MLWTVIEGLTMYGLYNLPPQQIRDGIKNLNTLITHLSSNATTFYNHLVGCYRRFSSQSATTPDNQEEPLSSAVLPKITEVNASFSSNPQHVPISNKENSPPPRSNFNNITCGNPNQHRSIG